MTSARLPRLHRPAATALAALLLGLSPAPPARPADEATEGRAFFERVAAAWSARDLGAWLGLWDFATPEARAEEEGEARAAFEASETSLVALRAPSLSAGGGQLFEDVQAFVVNEPRAKVAYWRLTAEKRPGGWALVSRRDAGQVDGLVHLSLGREAWRARGVSLHVEDLELKLEDGTLYSSAAIGPSALVFVGRARVLFQPRPAAEREQLRQFCGKPALDASVPWLFVRLHPGDFRNIVDADRLAPEPDPEARRPEAERVFRERVSRSFLLDAPLPRSPWWLLPGYGDALVEFPWRKRRVLTYALSAGEAEDVNLFDRDRHQQICAYPSAGRPVHYNEDARRSVDVLDQQLSVRFEPDRFELTAVHSMRVRTLGAGATLRLRLDDDLRVTSVQTGDGANLLFFRVRDQDSLVVSLGGLAEREQPITLVTRYSGRHDPAPVDQELLQLPGDQNVDEVFVERSPIVYSNRTSWYPRPPTEEFAPASLTLDTPEGWLAVTGGELRSLHTEARRTRAEFRLAQPGKFLTAVVGRLADMGLRQENEQSVRSYATARLRSSANANAQLAQEMLAFYATRYGPCPYPFVGLVTAEGETPGGHSPPGLVYLQRRPPVLHRHLADDPANFSDLPGFFLAHELAHQWWGQGTAPGSYRERWLSEAWAQYSAALWLRQRLGEDAFRSMMERMARWALQDDAQGPISLGQRVGALRGDPRIFRAVVYDKGAWVIHMLRGIVGDEAFFRGSRQFLESHRFAKATSEDLRSALEAASGRDLRPYFERWVYDTGLPFVEWSARTDAGRAGFTTVVEARPRALPGSVPLQITVESDAGRETQRVVLDAGGGSWSVVTRTRPRKVALNEDLGLLARWKRVARLPAPAQR
jgi:hypothetical protein